MIEVWHELAPIIGGAGPPALLAIVTLMFFFGKIFAKSTVDKMLAAKDDLIRVKDDEKAALKTYYEGRITDINAAHVERGADLRRIAENDARALQVSVDNVRKLLVQNDELLEIARVSAPVLLAARRAAEENNGTE